jgi:hypothetical protein
LYSIEEHGERRYLKAIAVEDGTGAEDSFLLPESRFAWPYAVSSDGRYVAGLDKEDEDWVSVLDRHTGEMISIEGGERYIPGLLFDPQTNALVIATGNKISFWALEGLLQSPDKAGEPSGDLGQEGRGGGSSGGGSTSGSW